MKQSEIKNLVDDGWIHVKVIIEIAGTPEEFINKTIKELADKFEKENDIKPVLVKINKANEIGEKVFSAFLDAEFLVAKLSRLFGIIYDYMPSSVEIVQPDSLSETTANMSDMINDLTAKLHQYDNVFKQLHAKNVILQNQLAGRGVAPSKKTKSKKK